MLKMIISVSSPEEQHKAGDQSNDRNTTPQNKRQEIATPSHANHRVGDVIPAAAAAAGEPVGVVDQCGEETVDERADGDVGDEDVVVHSDAVWAEKL